MRLIEHNILGLRIAGLKRPGQQQWNKVTPLPPPPFRFLLSFLLSRLDRHSLESPPASPFFSFFSFLFVIVFFASSVHSFESRIQDALSVILSCGTFCPSRCDRVIRTGDQRAECNHIPTWRFFGRQRAPHYHLDSMFNRFCFIRCSRRTLQLILQTAI